MGDDGWAEKQIPGGNYRQKSKGEGGLAFVISHPSPQSARQGWGTLVGG
jgi:hypothetical protein